MGNPRARYTQEFMLEAVRMVRGGQSMAAVAKILGISPKTLHNWVKADAAGKLNGAGKQVSPEQMEIARLRAELARGKMERDILEKPTAYFAKGSACSTPGSSFTADNGRCPCPARCCVSAPAVTTRARRVMSILTDRADASATTLCWCTSRPCTLNPKASTAGRACGSNCWPRAFASARIVSSGS